MFSILLTSNCCQFNLDFGNISQYDVSHVLSHISIHSHTNYHRRRVCSELRLLAAPNVSARIQSSASITLLRFGVSHHSIAARSSATPTAQFRLSSVRDYLKVRRLDRIINYSDDASDWQMVKY